MKYDEILYKTTKKAIDDLGQPVGKTRIYESTSPIVYDMKAIVKYKKQAVQSSDYIIQLNDQYTFTMLEPININWYIGWNGGAFKVKSIDNSIKGIYTMYCDTVAVNPKHAYEIIINNENPINTKVGNITTINCTCKTDGQIVQEPNITYISDNDNVTIEGNKVTSIKEGSSVITCTYEDVKATILINISKADEYAIQCNDISVDNGSTYQLEPICTKNGVKVENPTINYTVKDSLIAEISRDGLVSGVSAGNTTITLLWNGVSKTINVTVNEVIINYSINGADTFLHKTNSEYTLSPSNKNCIWSIDEDSIDLDICYIVNQTPSSCIIHGNETRGSEFFTLYAKDGDTILAEKEITIKKIL